MANPRLLRFAGQTRINLAENPRHVYAANRALCHFASQAVYSFIPKNACSTLRLSLALANGCISSLDQWTWIHANNPTFRANLRDLATARFTFVILRCPHARLASVFLDKVVGRNLEYWQIFHNLRDTLDPDRFSFRDFVDFVTSTPERLKMNDHWRPQEDFLVYADYDAWYAVEVLAAARNDLADRIGLDLVDARPLTQHGTDRFALVEDPGCADMSLTEIAALQAKGRAPSHGALYDADLAAKVAQSYASDLALYRRRIGATTLTFPQADFL